MGKKYEIQWRVEALAHISMVEEMETTSFSSYGISFSHWGSPDLSWRESNYWIAKGFVEASNLDAAIGDFYAKLAKLIPRIALISQCYIEFVSQPFLVRRFDENFVYFRYTRNSESVGLMFGDEEKKALEVILKNKEIPEAFYYYWNDAVNSIGYSSKLLLMCAALDAMAKVGLSRDDRKYKEKNFTKISRRSLAQT